ncbi:MAG: hypothetical protein JXA28_02290 [Bacteroidetes bacterium]|nr:hypothetical protein [Bacteroidota bacterium]
MTETACPIPTIERIETLAELQLPEEAVVIADRQLPREYLSRFPDPVLVEAGERLKTLQATESLATAVLQRRSSKPLTLVAVGGGSVGDAVGFLASILWRGVTLWHVPTTLLAMVDSAHGGKTAVNIGAAKNQLGTFYPAERVIFVEEFLSSLPVHQRREGTVELLKALWLGDAAGSRAITAGDVEALTFAPYTEIASILSPLLDAAVRIKQRIVAEDPREERGIRTVLNLGHTIGHALELITGIGHGTAVAWGLAASLHFSQEEGMLPADLQHCRQTLFPLLVPLTVLPGREELRPAMARDKKHSGDRLRSVVLRSLGEPHLRADLSADRWIDALESAIEWFSTAPVTVYSVSERSVSLTIEASKSELNRALIIAAQRIGRTCIHGKSSADDVTHMVRALRRLEYPVDETGSGYVIDNLNRNPSPGGEEESRRIYVGEGGTTLRFLLALCATSVRRTKIVVPPALFCRPHEPLLRALRSGGASVEQFDDLSGQGFIVRGWREMPQSFSVETEESSQFASALALLAVGAERPFTLRLLGHTVSTSYLRMTLDLLELAGVESIWHEQLIALNQTERLKDKLKLEIEQDASSSAVWSVARFLGHPARSGRKVRVPRQPDSAVDRYLSLLRSSSQSAIEIDVSDVPDLLPILTVAALTADQPVTFRGAAHLRNKESNRLDAFAASMTAVGFAVESHDDGLRVRPGNRIAEGRVFHTHGDHRLVMAAALLSYATATALQIDQPWSVTKSYPRFWDDLRQAGWSVRHMSDPAQVT